jgi:hypothetical protein
VLTHSLSIFEPGAQEAIVEAGDAMPLVQGARVRYLEQVGVPDAGEGHRACALGKTWTARMSWLHALPTTEQLRRCRGPGGSGRGGGHRGARLQSTYKDRGEAEPRRPAR